MANNPMDQMIVNARERPLSSDINQAQSQLYRSMRDYYAALFTQRASASDDSSAAPPTGFVGDGLKVRPTSPTGMSVRLAAGWGFRDDALDVVSDIGGVVGVDDLSRYKPLVLLAQTTFSGIPIPSVNPRIDIIEVRQNRVAGGPLSRDILNTGTGVFDPTSVNKNLAYTLDGSTSSVVTPAASTGAMGYKRGAEAASPVAPATTSGYVKIAEIRIAPSDTVITSGMIKDLRPILFPHGIAQVAGEWSVVLPGGLVPGVPTVISQITPPGVQMVMLGVLGTVTRVYIVAGAGFTKATGNANTRAASGVSAATLYLNGGTAGRGTFGTLTALEATNLNGANASPATLFAEGQPRVYFDIFSAPVDATSSPLTLAVSPSPMIVNFQATLG